MRIASPKLWSVRGYDETHAADLAARLGVSPVVAGVLTARGVSTEEAAQKLLHPALDQLHDPSLMLGMSDAATRVLRAVDAGEQILIYGDYDVDGTTGTVVLRRVLQLLGAETRFHVPHRFTEGYGIRQDVLERAKGEGCTLVISVDCGIRAHEPLEWARANGLDVIVTDHHLPDADEGAPPAFAVLNPNQRGCNYPDKHLAGVGVAFKLAHEVLRRRGRENLVKGFLKVVAIGTVADVAPLVGENRAIVALGLADIVNATNPGLRALLEVAGCGDGRDMRCSDLGFRLGPRINAAGRMDAARAVVELFETDDPAEARRLAEHLDARNRERQAMQRAITQRAVAEYERSGDCGAVAVIAGDGWHRGVIGLAASRIAEKLARPCVVISLEGDLGHGSARSVEGYHLLDGLTACADLFETFGGHAQAAGLTIRRENIAELRRRLHEHASRFLVDAAECAPVVKVDAELPADALTPALADELARLEPFGAQWPRPVFLSRNVRVVKEARVLKERHLKFEVAAGRDARPVEVLWWGGAEEAAATPRAGDRIEVAYAVETNIWRGEKRLQLIVEDMRISKS
ncbi:MAG TPA: single-stranded-DNA-specific exonuclease RecJ [Pyrinomonadaceae bacterium]|jgi:single-stranded-DNA-specific exonuclease|nr:single-stranded-DNA-specific exonuclease RecJ [Pyrinomonadaceae bacterium]